jgi:hypothetical protein
MRPQLIVILLGILSLTLGSTQSQEPQDDLFSLLEDIEPKKWESFYNVRAGLGWKDNLLLSKSNKLTSPFTSLEAEAFLWRYPNDAWNGHMYFTADHKKYLDGNVVDKEQVIIGQGSAERTLNTNWSTAIEYQYFYQDQVFDDTLTDTFLGTIQAQGHNLALTPSIKRKLGDNHWINFESEFERQYFKAPLDNYRETSPKLTLGRKFTKRSQMSLSYEFDFRRYETRQEIADDGTRLDGSSLSLYRHRLELGLKYYFGANERWRTYSRLRYRINDGSGSGYFDYKRFLVIQQLQYDQKSWLTSAEIRLGDYDYDTQTIDSTSATRRSKQLLSTEWRIEKSLTKRLKFIASYEYERSKSNLNFDDYQVNVFSLTFDWEF